MGKLVGLCLLAFVFVAGCGGPSGPQVASAPLTGSNVVLILVDTLRADHVGAYGYDKPTTPYIDSLAQQGLVFEQAYANSSFLTQSLAALLSGRLPTSGGTIGMTEAAPPQQTMTLAQHFQAAGYQTGITTNQGLIKAQGFTKGFGGVQIDSFPGTWNAEEVTKRALTFVEDAGDDKFFLYVHYAEPHHPYTPPEEYRERMVGPQPAEPLDLAYFREHYNEITKAQNLVEDERFLDWIHRYDGEIAYVDDAIEQLVEGLEAQGKLDNTLFIITSPHGVEFLEHGYVQQAWTLYDEVIRVPLILWKPGAFTPQRLAGEVSLVDLVPTLTNVLELPSERDDLDSRGFLAAQNDTILYTGGKDPVISELVIRERAIMRAVIHNESKYISYLKWFAPAQRDAVSKAYTEIANDYAEGDREVPPLWNSPVREELFDLATDPGEQNNLIEKNTVLADRLRRVLQKYEEFCEKHALTPKAAHGKGPDLDPEQLKQLEDLGYL